MASMGDYGGDLSGVEDLSIEDEERDTLGELGDLRNKEELERESRIDCMNAKAAHPEMFVSGFDVDDQGIEGPDDPDCPGERLLTAAEEGYMELAQELVSRAPGLVAYKDKDGYTPLHRAAYTDNASMVRFLLAKGAKVNEVTEDGWTPLHSASHWNSFKAVRELVDHFADVNATTNGGQTPLHIASSQQARESMIILLNCPNINLKVKNKLGETAEDLAKRAGRFHCLFDMAHEAINKL